MTSTTGSYSQLTGDPRSIVGGVYIGISAFTIVVNVIEIILFARKRLSPVVAVVINSVTTVIWLAMFVILVLATVG